MGAQFNHTIVYAAQPAAAARYVTELLDLPAPTRFGPFWVVRLDNGVALDFLAADEKVQPQHYAFLIGEAEFDAVLGRICAQGVAYWADPAQRRAGEINYNDGGRGVYFAGPDGHLLEVITRPYGGA